MNGDTYSKFMVNASSSTDFPGSRVPFTGIELTLEYAKEKLEKGYTVHIVPYTQAEWASKTKGYSGD